MQVTKKEYNSQIKFAEDYLKKYKDFEIFLEIINQKEEISKEVFFVRRKKESLFFSCWRFTSRNKKYLFLNFEEALTHKNDYGIEITTFGENSHRRGWDLKDYIKNIKSTKIALSSLDDWYLENCKEGLDFWASNDLINFWEEIKRHIKAKTLILTTKQTAKYLIKAIKMTATNNESIFVESKKSYLNKKSKRD